MAGLASTKASFALALLATCLTEIENRVNGQKERVWNPGELGDHIQPESMKPLSEALTKIIIDARDTSFPWFTEAVEMVKDKDNPINDIFAAIEAIDARKAEAGDVVPPVEMVQPKKSTGSTEQ